MAVHPLTPFTKAERRVNIHQFAIDLLLTAEAEPIRAVFKTLKRSMKLIQFGIAFERQYRVDLMKRNLILGEELLGEADGIGFFEMGVQSSQNDLPYMFAALFHNALRYFGYRYLSTCCQKSQERELEQPQR
ncbi:MAG TPA: hypothetical protein DGH68_00015 [Bacteroidetes bacterium]|nr:hypothetical protein [Bacteroidota bacterium]